MVVAATGAVADNEIIEKMVTEKRIGVWTEPEVTNKAYMDVSIGGTPAGRLVISVRMFVFAEASPSPTQKIQTCLVLSYVAVVGDVKGSYRESHEVRQLN